MTLVSVLGLAVEPSLQVVNEYPVFGVGVTAVPDVPVATVCDAVPTNVPLAPAV